MRWKKLSFTGTPLQNCWEFMNCPEEKREECMVYEEGWGKDCWIFIDYAAGCHSYAAHNSCLKCPWFRKIG